MPTVTGLPLPSELFKADDGRHLPDNWKQISYVGARVGGRAAITRYPLLGSLIHRSFPAESQSRNGIRLVAGVAPHPGDLGVRSAPIDPGFVVTIGVLGDTGLEEVKVSLAPEFNE